MAHEVSENRLELALGKLKVISVRAANPLHVYILAEERQEVLLHVVVGLRRRKLEIEDAQTDRNLVEKRAVLSRRDGDCASVESWLRVLADVHSEHELLVLVLLESRARERWCIGEPRLHAGKRVVDATDLEIDVALVDAARRGKPEVADRPVLRGDTRPVALLLGIDLHEILVVEKKFGAELKARILEVANPGVGVLVPDLDRREVQLLCRDYIALLVLQVADAHIDFAEIGVGSEDERAALVFAAGGNHCAGRVLDGLSGERIGENLALACRRDGEADDSSQKQH